MPSNKFDKAFNQKQNRFRATWIRNAAKSVGLTMNSVLSEVAPNTVEIASTSNEIARTVLGTLNKGRTGINKVNDFGNNQYAKIGKTAIRNAMDSIKTGKFGDPSSMFGMMDMGGGMDDGFSYGDDDIGSESPSSLSGLASLSDQINKQSIAQIKTAQANMDTMISINSARMYQTQQISSEILNHITNIENSLASMVQFNNETMLKFVQASMGYYERTGAAITAGDKSEFTMPEFRHSQVLKSSKGGFSFANYKEYIKKNIANKIDESGLGIAMDETTLQMLAADPIGFAAQIAATSMINKFAGGAIKGVEDRLTSAIPKALMSLTKLSDSNNPVLRLIGDIFGLRSERKNSNLSDIRINKGPIPFDGETKHAITSVITHELRNQTGYLKIIADHFNGGDSSKLMEKNREFFNERTGKYERGMNIDFNIAKAIEDSVTSAFKETGFGADLTRFTSNISNEKDRKEMERVIDDLYMEIMHADTDNLSITEILEMVSKLGASKNAKKLLEAKLRKMNDINKTNFMSVNVGKLRSREYYNDSIKNIRENGSQYYLEESGMMGLKGEDLENYIRKTLKSGKGNYRKLDDADLIEITQDPDYFAQLKAEGRLTGILAKIDSATMADYNSLAKKGVRKADKAWEKVVKQIKDTDDYKEILRTAKSARTSIVSGARDVAGAAGGKAKGFIGGIGSQLSEAVSHITGGLHTRTGMISNFLFGNQTKGTKGLFDGIADSFNKGLKRDNPDLEMTDGTKAVTMGGIGALTGAALAKLGFLPAILSTTGPIGGAIAGLTLAIAGAGPMFKKALFGGDVEEFEDEKGNKYKHKKKGLIGRIGSTVEANLINPIKTAAIYAINRTALNVENGILIPFKYLARFGAEKMGDAVRWTFGKLTDIGKTIADPNSLINRLTGGLFSFGTKAVGNVVSGAANIATNIGSRMINAPGNALGTILSIFSPDLYADFAAERAGNRARVKAAKALNENRKKHDANAKIIAKYTNGQYSEDSEEARAYLRLHRSDIYEKYFVGKNGKVVKGQIGSIDEEKGIKKLYNQNAGKLTQADITAYDPTSQTAIMTARMVVMQEQLIRATLGEKVEYSATADASLVKGNHDKQKSDKQRRKEAKRGKGKKYLDDLKKRYANNERLTEDEEETVRRVFGDEIEELDWQRDFIGRKNEAKAHLSNDNSFLNKLKARFSLGAILREGERHEAEKLGLRKKKGGNGFGGFGPLSKTVDDLRAERKEKEEKAWKDKVLDAITGVKKETKEHKEGWASIFSKKGLITGALILAAPLLLKVIPKVFNWFKDNGAELIESIPTVLGEVWNVLSGIGSAVYSILGVTAHGIQNSQDTDKTGISNVTGSAVNVGANVARIAAHSGDYAARSIATAPKGLKGILGRTKVAKAARLNKNVNTVLGKGFQGIKSAGRAAFTTAGHADVLEKTAYKIAGIAPDTAEKMLDKSIKLSEKAASGGGLFNKVKGFISKFYDDFLAKFTKKFGSTAPSLKAFAKEKLIDFLQKHFGKIGEKLAAKLAAGTTSAGVTLGLSEVAFATIGAINGLTGAAKLFHVPSDKVDGTMRAISGLFGGFAGTTIGGVIDLIFQLIYQFTGVDFLNGIATTLYVAAKKLTGDEKAIENLQTNQKALNDEYDEYKNSELKKAYDIQLKTGAIPSTLSFEEFVAGVADGTYKANFDSQADYIAKNHGSIGDKMMQGIGKGFKATMNAARTYSKYTALVSFETTYTDSNGNTYTQNANGTYDIMSPEGEKLGEIEKNMIPDDATKKTKVSTAAGNWLQLGKQFLAQRGVTKKTATEAVKNAATIVKDTYSKTTEFWNNVKQGGINFIRKKTIDRYAIYRPVDNPLSYYKLNNSGSHFDWYNSNGELIEKDAKTYEDVMTLYGNGLMTKDKTVAGAKLAVKTNISNTLNTVGSTISNLWDKGVTAVSNMWDKLKSKLKGEEDTESTPGGKGGRGAMYSQNDPRWKNAKYGSDATMGDSGCGPTAVAMAMSDVTGRSFTPMQMAGLAQATGDRDATGTNWNFVNNAASMMGVPSTQVYSPSAGYIGGQLAAGNELILSGRTGGYGYGGRGSAYTPAGHYIVGTGIDRNGIVSYKDPTTGGMGRIPLSMLSAETGSAWRLGGRGPAALEAGNIGTDYSAPVAAAQQKPTTASTTSTTEPTSSKNTGWIGKKTIDTSETNSLNYRPDKAYNQTSKKEGEAEYRRWLETVAYVKKYASNKQPKYDQNAHVTVELPDGRKIKMRTDCSGFVSCCLDAYGAFKPGTVISSTGFNNSKHIAMTNAGFIPMSWPGWDKLVIGDIIATNGHVEIFAENDGNKHKVWNWGSGSSASNPGITSSSHKSYTLVWRHPSAAEGGNISASDISGDLSGANSSNGDATVSGKANTMGTWDKITGIVSDVLGSAFNRLIGGDWDNTDYSEIRNKYFGDSTTTGETNEHVASSGITHSDSSGTFGSTDTGTSTSSGEPMSYGGTPVKNYNEAVTTLNELGLSDTKKNFYEKILNGSLQSKRDYSILPSISMSQAWIESSNKNGPGMSGLTQKANNLFGIKASKNWTGGTVTMRTAEYDSSGNKYYVDAPFRSYASWDDSIIDHGKFLQTKRYTDVRNASNYVDAAKALQAAGYATSPTYASSLIDKIETDKLYAFDTYGGSGRGVSIHNRNYAPSYHRPNTGGRGYSINPSTTGYYGPSYRTVYGGRGVPTDTEKMLGQIVNIITNILQVESGASSKLDMLGNISGGSNNVIVANGGGGDTINLDMASRKMGNEASSRNFKQAHRLAMQKETSI